jgi:hypothetical protein
LGVSAIIVDSPFECVPAARLLKLLFALRLAGLEEEEKESDQLDQREPHAPQLHVSSTLRLL